MSDLERLDEALTWDLEYVAAIAKGDPDLTFEPLEVIVNAARAYRDYLADPVAAAANLDGVEPVEWCVVHGQRALAVGDKWKGTCFHNFGCRSESRLVIPPTRQGDA